MLKILLVKKEKGRVYKSDAIVKTLFGLELSHDKEGAPHVEGSFISVTDTKNYWACCVSDHPVGIDMEEAGRVVRPAVVRRFHKSEQEYLSVLSEGSREWSDEFMTIWTRKEAWSKLKGKGYAIGFSKFSVLDGSIEGIPVACFTRGKLFFGIAGDDKAEVEERYYDAPMERSALDYAADLLDVRAYSAAALSKKLQERGYRQEEIDTALEKLKEYNYINDESYAASVARRAAQSGKGTRRIAAELSQKGIDKELSRAAAEEYRQSDRARAEQIARKILEKDPLSKDIGAEADMYDEDYSGQKKELMAKRQKLVGKISRKLSSLGYDASVIWSVIEDLL